MVCERAGIRSFPQQICGNFSPIGGYAESWTFADARLLALGRGYEPFRYRGRWMRPHDKEDPVIRKSRLPIAIGLVLALGISGIAYGDGASDNQAFVDGNVKPRKLHPKRFQNVNLFTGVRTETDVDGTQSNPASELIKFGRNVRLRPGAAPRCRANLPNGSTTQQARNACPRKSYLGAGEAEVVFPPPQGKVDDVVVSVFNGPAKGQVRLHTYSPTLVAASPTVQGRVVKAAGRRFGQALSVPNSPETGSGMITKFNATINRGTGVAQARCRAKRFFWQRTVTYNDGSSETVRRSQRCKKRR